MALRGQEQIIQEQEYHQRSMRVASLRTTLGLLLVRSFSSLNLLKQRTGQCSRRARFEFSQFLISGMLAKRQRRPISRLNFPTSSGNTDSSRLSSSQTTKSMRVKQPQYHPSAGHSCSQSRRMGSILLAQQKLRFFFSSGEREGRAEQISPRTAPLRSCLLLMLSMRTRSARVRPKRSVLPARSMTQLIMPAGPVTTKSWSRRKGRSRTTHSAASPSLNCVHWSGVKNWSTQGRCRYSHSRRHICAFPRIGQYPIVTARLASSAYRTQGRIAGFKLFIVLFFSGRPSTPSCLPPPPSSARQHPVFILPARTCPQPQKCKQSRQRNAKNNNIKLQSSLSRFSWGNSLTRSGPCSAAIKMTYFSFYLYRPFSCLGVCNQNRALTDSPPFIMPELKVPKLSTQKQRNFQRSQSCQQFVAIESKEV